MSRLWIRIIMIAALLMGVTLTAAADNGPHVSLSVKEDVKRSRSKDRKGDTAEWPHFSIFRDIKSKNCTLQMLVSNQGEKDTPCQLEWYFIVEKRINKETDPVRTVVRPGKKQIALQPGAPVETTATARFEYARIVADEFKKYGSQNIERREYFEGEIYIGYIVLVTVDDDIIASKTSNTWLMDDKWIKRCRASLP